jgi:glycosyltransferase involved in cell wall biosynthesis
MRYLVISPQPFFTPRGTPFSVYYRTLILSELGANIDLLTYGQGADPDIPNVRVFRTPRFAWLGSVRTGPSMLKLFLDVFIAARAIGLLIRHRYDVVHAHEEAVFICRFLKPIFRFKLVYDMHSSLTQQLTNFDYTDSKIIHYIFKKLEDSSINAADAVITICPDLANYVSRIITDPERHYLIENSIHEPVRLKNSSSAEIAHNWDKEPFVRPENCFLFVYAGTLESYQGIDLLLEAFRNVVAKRPDAFLLVVGGTGAQVDHYRAQVGALSLDEYCHFTGTVSQHQAHDYMRSADVLLSPRTEGTNTPLKVYQQLASGIPLVATNIFSHTQVLNDEVAFLAEPEADAFGEAMIAAMSDEQEATKRAQSAVRLYEEEYSRENYVRKLGTMLQGLR